jgi:hypothetical protein
MVEKESICSLRVIKTTGQGQDRDGSLDKWQSP